MSMSIMKMKMFWKFHLHFHFETSPEIQLIFNGHGSFFAYDKKLPDTKLGKFQQSSSNVDQSVNDVS